MSSEELEKLQVLSGEYVLGVLDDEAAREVEARLASSPELRRALAFWESQLEGLSALAPAADPPAGTWDRIAARLPSPSAPRRSPPRLWNSMALWRWSTAGAGLLAACLALYIAVAPRSASPAYVAVLRPPQQDQAAWVATAGTNGLLVRAVAQAPVPNDRSFELWAIAPGAAQPQPLGVIQSDGRLEIGALPAALRDGGTLAISIEPLGGSPTGQPTGPVVFSGTLVAAR